MVRGKGKCVRTKGGKRNFAGWGSGCTVITSSPEGVGVLKKRQCFPDSFKLSEGVTQAKRELGEAVPPCAAKALARELKKKLA